MISDRLARYSQRMGSVTLCFIVAMLLLNAARWLLPAPNSVEAGYGIEFGLTNGLISGLKIDVGVYPWWQKVGAALLSSVSLLALAIGLWHLRSQFQCYGRREFSSAATASHLAKVGRAV